MDWLGTVLPFIGQFNEQETSKQLTREERQWQEDMYNKYNSPSALVRQYKEAGINPALMFGGQTPAMDSSTAPAAVAPSPTGSLTDMLGQLLNLSLLEENRKNISADTRNKNATAASSEFKLEVDRQFALFERSYSLSEMIARINKLQSETDLNENELNIIRPLEAALLRAQEKGESASAAIGKWKAEFVDKYDSDPDADLERQAFTSVLEYLNSPERFWNKNPDRRKKNRD